MLMEAATAECSNALRIAEQRAMEWQAEIQEVQVHFFLPLFHDRKLTCAIH